MSWSAIAVLAIGAYVFKATGLLVIGDRPVGPRLERLIGLVPAALLTSLVVVQTLADGNSIALDARLPGVLAGGLAAWRNHSFVVVLIVAAAVTAALRQLGWN